MPCALPLGFVESDDEDVQTIKKTQNIRPTQHSTPTSSSGLEMTSFTVPDTRLAFTDAGEQVTEVKCFSVLFLITYSFIYFDVIV